MFCLAGFRKIKFLGRKGVNNRNFSAMADEVMSDEDFEKETQLLKDCIKRVRESGLKDQLKKLALEMKDKPQADTMEKMKRLQDEIRDLNQGKV